LLSFDFLMCLSGSVKINKKGTEFLLNCLSARCDSAAVCRDVFGAKTLSYTLQWKFLLIKILIIFNMNVRIYFFFLVSEWLALLRV
jgi:hypothetical protein